MARLLNRRNAGTMDGGKLSNGAARVRVRHYRKVTPKRPVQNISAGDSEKLQAAMAKAQDEDDHKAAFYARPLLPAHLRARSPLRITEAEAATGCWHQYISLRTEL